jgi:hypothetical protein
MFNKILDTTERSVDGCRKITYSLHTYTYILTFTSINSVSLCSMCTTCSSLGLNIHRTGNKNCSDSINSACLSTARNRLRPVDRVRRRHRMENEGVSSGFHEDSPSIHLEKLRKTSNKPRVDGHQAKI